MKAVNLLPADHRQVRQASFGSGLKKHSVALGGAVAAVAVAALLGMAWQSASSSAKSSQAELDALHARIAAASHPAQSADQSVRARILQVSTADSARVSWDGFMSKLARVLPENVWLTALNVGEPAPATPATPAAAPTTPAPAAAAASGFTVTGYTYSQASVARLMRRLKLLPWLSAVQLQTSTLTTVGASSAFQFTIVGGVNALPAKEAS